VSPEKSPSRLLIIDEDPQLLEALAQLFESEGHQVYRASTGQDGLSLANISRPNLILLSAQMPDAAGLDIFRSLRDQPRTGHIPVMILAGRSESMLQNKVLGEGAYDFLEKPLDLDILVLRVRNALRRAEREGLSEPRTGLPTGRLIQERLRTLEQEWGWYKMELKIDNFNVFRDLYGFVTANEALRFTGNLLAQVINEQGTANDFLGHNSGTEEFVIVTTLGRGPALHRTLSQRISQELESFYNFMEREQGYVLVEDETGATAKKPLMSAQIRVTQGEPDPNAAFPSSEDVWVDAVESGDSPPDDQPPPSTLEW
jgi:DNA-binding response OmpR family regulator